MPTINCLRHTDVKPGKVLKYTDGSLKFVTSTGALLNVVAREDGTLERAPKLSKKERVRARRFAALAAASAAIGS